MKLRTSITAMSIFVVAAVVVLLAFSAPPEVPTTHTITIEGMKFIPETIEVKSGDTVVWVNKDIFPHTATSSDKTSFDSGVIVAGASWQMVLTTKGNFPYICTLHPTMLGAVTVK